VFPDARSCLQDLIDGTEHLGREVTCVWHLVVEEGKLAGPFPLVQIITAPGTEGFLDRVDPVTLECYAEGNLARDVLESIKAMICGVAIETDSGYLDKIAVTSTPDDVYYTNTLNKAFATFDVTSRPVS
jgi:hypothetical protein